MTDTKPCKRCGLEPQYSHALQLCSHCRQTHRIIAGNAHQIVAKAIKAKKLLPPETLTCTDCDKPATCYDHRDYDKPLDVEPVCRLCNLKRGEAKAAFWHFIPAYIHTLDNLFYDSPLPPHLKPTVIRSPFI